MFEKRFATRAKTIPVRLTRALLACAIWLSPVHMPTCIAAPPAQGGMPELTAGEAALLADPGETRRLAEKVWKEGPQRDYQEIANHPRRLDSWLALGGMNAGLAARYSQPTLLAKLERDGINRYDCVATEAWMLGQFSISYWLNLRSVNQQRFRDADRASASIRKALWLIDEEMGCLTSDRSYTREMVWGQAEWLLHQAKPGFIFTRRPDRDYGRIPLSALRKELEDCRDASGAPCWTNLQRDLSEDGVRIDKTVRELSRCLESWTPAGKDYLLTEFLLVVRDRYRYYYGGTPVPRGIQVLGKLVYQNPASYGDQSTRIGKVMVTLSQGHREIWDPSPDCSMAKISWSDVSWVKNAKPGDTPATAKQWLRVIKDGISHDLHPRGGFILDFEGFVGSGASVLSADADGGIWLERFDLKSNEVIERYSLLKPPPKDLPDWATPFQQRWTRLSNA